MSRGRVGGRCREAGWAGDGGESSAGRVVGTANAGIRSFSYSMSLARSVFGLARPRTIFGSPQLRAASTSAHGTGHNDHHDSESHYPREDFSSSIWRDALIASLVAVAVYKYAPTPSDNVYLTRWIALYKTPRDKWLEINASHTAMQQDASAQNILLSDAKKDRVHHYRYPELLNQSSPFLNGVGM
ncbi:hypothetical protein AX17_005693 [Amanita inopinata Kibby_2008]|nr:hypothetical protein AX17_005693 [Amanita inopinata Kibby_2008]